MWYARPCSSLRGYSRTIDGVVTKKGREVILRFTVEINFVVFWLILPSFVFEYASFCPQVWGKVKGIWTLYETASHVRFARYGLSKFGHIQRTSVYHFWKVLNRIPHRSVKENKLSYLYRVLITYVRNISGRTLARL